MKQITLVVYGVPETAVPPVADDLVQVARMFGFSADYHVGDDETSEPQP